METDSVCSCFSVLASFLVFSAGVKYLINISGTNCANGLLKTTKSEASTLQSETDVK